jgi:phosphoglycerol transferase MdoB-like AlkP superfamily enzyme
MIRWILGIMLVLLFLMTLYRFLFFYHYRAPGRPFSGSAFILGVRYDLRIVSVIGLAMLLLSYIPGAGPFKRPGAARYWIALLSAVFFIFLLFYGADFYHYDYLQQRLNASVLNFLQDAGISFNMMWQTYPLLKIGLLVLVLVFVFGRLIKKMFVSINRSAVVPAKKRARAVWHVAFVLLAGIFIFGQLGQYPLRWSDAFRFADDFKANVALNPFQSFFSTLQFKNSTYDIRKVRKYYPVMADYLEVPRRDSVTLNFTRSYAFSDTFVNKPNVVVVICESFSAYKSSMFGNKLDPTPFFNGLCSKGVFFDRCFVPSFGTARGVWAVLTGIPDVESPKTASRNPSAVDQHSIMNDFANYNKFYFLGGSTTWANIRGVLTNNLSNLAIYEEENFKASKVDVWGISDKNLFLEANKVLAQQKKPFITIIQTADNHRPYTIPKEDQDAFKKVNYSTDTLLRYGFADNDELNAFRYTDFCFRKFIEAAEKEAYYKNTIFVFVGDHGLRGDAGTMFPQSFTKQGILAQHVPLLFYWPGTLQPARIHSVSSQLDVLPSAATLARQSYTNTAFGRNLFDTVQRKEKFAFIADPDLHTIGVVGNRYYYRENLKTGQKEFVPVQDNAAVAFDPRTDSLRNYMAVLTTAWYETAKYLLLNNKKKK